MPLVKDCLKNWNLMDGDTNEEKRLNAYICSVWIMRFDVPSDECVSYAKKLAKIKNPKNHALKVREILSPMFMAHDLDGNNWIQTIDEEILEKIVNRTIDFMYLVKDLK